MQVTQHTSLRGAVSQELQEQEQKQEQAARRRLAAPGGARRRGTGHGGMARGVGCGA